MYKKVNLKKLGRTKSHRESLINNQLRTLFSTGKLNTTTQKAKVVKAQAQSIISNVKSKKEGDLNLRRKLQVIFNNSELIKKVVEYSNKDEAKVSFVKVGFRSGDNAEVSRLVLEGYKTSKKAKAEKKADEVVEDKKVVKEDNKKNIEKLGRKSVTKKVTSTGKQRARTRSGL